MNIQTKYFGEVVIEEKQMIQFPQAIPGFPNQTNFVLLELPNNPIFHVLQSVTDEAVAFIVTNPYHFYKDYAFDLDDSTLELLEIKSEHDILVYVIVSLKEPFTSSTINLQAPIIINQTANKAKQYITNDKVHDTRTPITPSHTKEEK